MPTSFVIILLTIFFARINCDGQNSTETTPNPWNFTICDPETDPNCVGIESTSLFGMWWPPINETIYVDMVPETTKSPNPVAALGDSFCEVLIMFLETVKMLIVNVIKGRNGNGESTTGWTSDWSSPSTTSTGTTEGTEST